MTLLGDLASSRRSILISQGVQAGFVHDDWDAYIYHTRLAQKRDGIWLMAYNAYPNDNDPAAPIVGYPCIATSTDLENWNKPNLGQVSYGGSTNNNIIISASSSLEAVTLIVAEDKYVLAVYNTGSNKMFPYTSLDGETWTWSGLTLDLSAAGPHGQRAEFKDLTWHDGTWRGYYNQGQTAQTRSIGFYQWSDGLNGTPIDQGIMTEFTNNGATEQFYDIQCFHDDGKLWAAVNIFNSVSDVLGPIRLYRSLDEGDSFEKFGTLLELGLTGSWNENLLANGKPVFVDGQWLMMFAGSDGLHGTWPRTMQLGKATTGTNLTSKLNQILAEIAAGAVLQNAVADSTKINLINQDAYDGTAAPLLSWTVAKDYTLATSIQLIFFDQNDVTQIYKQVAGVVASTVLITVDVDVDFGSSLTFSGCPLTADCGFALIADWSGNLETIAYGMAYVADRGQPT